jgi:hypothetical protein
MFKAGIICRGLLNLLMQGCVQGAYLQLRAQLWVLICVDLQDSDSVPKVIIDLQHLG